MYERLKPLYEEIRRITGYPGTLRSPRSGRWSARSSSAGRTPRGAPYLTASMAALSSFSDTTASSDARTTPSRSTTKIHGSTRRP